MNKRYLDLSKASGEIGLLLLTLSISAYGIWLMIYVLDIWSTEVSSWNYFAVASIVLIFALVLLAYNYWQTRKTSNIPDWIIFKQDSKQVLPPLCERCSTPARWAIEFDSWFCDTCKFYASL